MILFDLSLSLPQSHIPHLTGCIRDLSVSGRKAYLLSESNRVQAATKCFRSVEPGYYFEKGLLAHEIRRPSSSASSSRRGRGDSSRLDIELDFRTVKDGILVHTIGDQTDLFLSLNQGQVGGRRAGGGAHFA